MAASGLPRPVGNQLANPRKEQRQGRVGNLDDLPAQVIGALALAALTWGLIERAPGGWGSAAEGGAFGACVAGALLVLRLEKMGRQPMLPLKLFASRTFPVLPAAPCSMPQDFSAACS
jgi:hypothetical protein